MEREITIKGYMKIFSWFLILGLLYNIFSSHNIIWTFLNIFFLILTINVLLYEYRQDKKEELDIENDSSST